MEYALDNYSSFEDEHRILASESRKKEELEKQRNAEEKEIEFRFKCISGYFLRLSWNHKKQFILSIVKSIDCFDTLLRIIGYISTLCGKLASYADVCPHSKGAGPQIIVDHDRSLEWDYFKNVACKDLNWLATLPRPKLLIMLMKLLYMAGGGLLRKMYIPIVNIYNEKLVDGAKLKKETLQIGRELDDIFEDTDLDDTDKYPRNHPLTTEVEKLRKKWAEMIAKYKLETFETDRKPNPKNKPDHKGKTKMKGKKAKTGKISADSIDWIQMLPIWIVKKIFDHFDSRSLKNLKKVNHYWSYACDSLIKDRQARERLDNAIKKMVKNVDPEVLKQHRQSTSWNSMDRKPESPREKRLKKLTNRGAVLSDMRPSVRKSKRISTSLITSIPRGEAICDPIDKITVFPRLIKEDLLLYKNYPCILKDVDILIDVEEDVKKQRDTLSYSLNKQLSDMFSMSEADLADW